MFLSCLNAPLALAILTLTFAPRCLSVILLRELKVYTSSISLSSCVTLSSLIAHFLFPDLRKKRVQQLHRGVDVCLECFQCNVVRSCCFIILQLLQCPPGVFLCTLVTLDGQIHLCWLYFWRVQWGRSVQKFFKIFDPSVELLLSALNAPSFFAFHGSF